MLAGIKDDKRLGNGLVGFANFCVKVGIAPTSVNDEVVEGYLTWLATRTLEPRPSSPSSIRCA